MTEETPDLTAIRPGLQGQLTSPSDDLDPENIELVLASVDLNDMARLLEKTTGVNRYAGPLTARLVELGGHAPKDGSADGGQIYAETMRLQKQRLEQDPAARRELALHPRTYGRPARQLITEADDWVVPMVEAEIGQMSTDDLVTLRHHLVMRVGRQHDIHPDFRPLLLNLTTDDHMLQCLASVEQSYNVARPAERSYLLAAVAAPFIDVIMNDADDGIELEAAAWDFAQRRLARASVKSGSQQLIQALEAASSLLALIDTSRVLAARESQAHDHAGIATRSAVAEFVLSNLILLSTKPDGDLRQDDLSIGAFVRRDLTGRSPVEIPEATLEAWLATRTTRRLLLDLTLVMLLTDYQRYSLPPMQPLSGELSFDTVHRLLAEIERQTIGKMAVQAINNGWYQGDWAGAA